MFALRNVGKCILNTYCGCIPGNCSERMFQKLFMARSTNPESTWEYLKEKLGLQKKVTKRDLREEIDPKTSEHEHVEVPMDSNNSSEMWKPGYRGRTENKRY